MALTKITTNIIADDAVTADKIAAGAIDSTHVTGLSTSDISEGTNLYFTDARVGSYLTTNSYATESYVTTAVSNLVDAAPATLDTLNELAAALGDDANFSTTVTNSIATKVSKSGDTITGNLDIVGTLTTDGVTSSERITISNTTSPELRFYDANNVNTDFLIYSPDGTNSLQIKAGSGQEDAFYLSSSGAVAFYDSTGTTQSFYWDSTNERLGIGTTSPATTLDVEGNITLSGSNGKIYLPQTPNTFNWIGDGIEQTGIVIIPTNDGTSERIVFAVDNSEAMRITSAGNVGIGTTAPLNPLHVKQSGGTHLAILETSYSTDRSGRGQLSWRDASDITGAIWTEYDGSQVSMRFGNLYNSGYNTNTSMIIRGGGNVGIGIADPPSLLHIAHAGHGIGFDYVGSTLPNTAGLFTSSSALTQTAYGDLNIKARSDYGGYYGIGFFTASANGAPLNRMTITSNGAVLIGTTYNGANSSFVVHQASGTHARSIQPPSGITNSGEPAVMAEGTISVNAVSSGNKLSIPVFSQGNVWKRYTVEMMFTSGEYNDSGNLKYGTATISFASLTFINHLTLAHSTGNVASVSSTGMNVEINFTSGYTGGLNNYEGVLVYYKVLGPNPAYFQAWNATLN